MKSMVLALFILALASAPAAAQEVSPEVQAMSSKLMREVSEGLQCQITSIKLAKENEALKARVREFEDKEKSSAK